MTSPSLTGALRSAYKVLLPSEDVIPQHLSMNAMSVLITRMRTRRSLRLMFSMEGMFEIDIIEAFCDFVIEI